MAGFQTGRIEADDQADDRQSASLAALAAVLSLILAGLFLVQVLHREARLENCLLAGRANCDALMASTMSIAAD